MAKIDHGHWKLLAAQYLISSIFQLLRTIVLSGKVQCQQVELQRCASVLSALCGLVALECLSTQNHVIVGAQVTYNNSPRITKVALSFTFCSFWCTFAISEDLSHNLDLKCTPDYVTVTWCINMWIACSKIMIYIVAALPASRSLFKGYFRNLVLDLLSWLRKACPLIPDWLFLIIISSTKDVPTVKEVEQHGGLASALYTHRYVFLSYVASFVIVGEWFIKYTVRFCTLSRISDDPEQHGTLFVTVDSVQASSIKFTPQLWFTVVDLVIGYWQYFLLVSFSYPTPCSVWFPYFHSRPAVVCAVWDVPVHKESHPSFLSSEHCGTNQIMLNNSAAVMILKCSLSLM